MLLSALLCTLSFVMLALLPLLSHFFVVSLAFATLRLPALHCQAFREKLYSTGSDLHSLLGEVCLAIVVLCIWLCGRSWLSFSVAQGTCLGGGG